jgi:hypothetical protein
MVRRKTQFQFLQSQSELLRSRVAEKLVLVGLIPEVIALDSGDQVTWYSNAGTLKIEFDPQRCPFSSNVLQAPQGVRLQSGTPRAGLNPGSYRYRLSINEALIGHGEILIRAK